MGPPVINERPRYVRTYDSGVLVFVNTLSFALTQFGFVRNGALVSDRRRKTKSEFALSFGKFGT